MATRPRKHILLGPLVGASLMAAPALADAEAMVLPFVKGPGAEECLRYITAYHQPSDKYQRYVAWLQGYASRIGLEEAIKKGRIVDYLNGAPVKDIALWLDQWCERNPFKSFYLAGVAFIKHASGQTPVPDRDTRTTAGGDHPATGGRDDH